ncbi:MAG TPA: type II toxin-antitoxin system VapC family toxin, partial [Brevibacterium sp.]|nr:type II toxin-antitoxin system VapC family toxin [Brevibacterium sp.]
GPHRRAGSGRARGDPKVSTQFTCDTSVLVPALMTWHEHHDTARRAVLDGVQLLPAHVLLESYSVLTRLPAPHRIAPEDAAEAIAGLPMTAVSLPGDVHARLVAELGRARLQGGATYDALVAATAHHHDLRLLTRDRRARATYDALGAAYTVV